MKEKKPIITLLGAKLARIGFSFIREGSSDTCEECALSTVCVSKLKVGNVYTVTAVKEKVFPCEIHVEGVRVVEVIEADIEANIEGRAAFLYGTITFQPSACNNLVCEHYARCVPVGLKRGDKAKIIEVKEQVVCPLNYRLVSTVLQKVEGQDQA